VKETTHGKRKLESDGGGKYNWSWSPEQGKSDGEKPYLRCQGDERTGRDGERKETIGVDFFWPTWTYRQAVALRGYHI